MLLSHSKASQVVFNHTLNRSSLISLVAVQQIPLKTHLPQAKD